MPAWPPWSPSFGSRRGGDEPRLPCALGGGCRGNRGSRADAREGAEPSGRTCRPMLIRGPRGWGPACPEGCSPRRDPGDVRSKLTRTLVAVVKWVLASPARERISVWTPSGLKDCLILHEKKKNSVSQLHGSRRDIRSVGTWGSHRGGASEQLVGLPWRLSW